MKFNIKSKLVYVFTIISFINIFYTKSFLFAETADELYRQGMYREAEKEYQKKDLENPKDIRYRYNRGCAAFKNSNYQGAIAAFSSVLKRTSDAHIQFNASFNLGNIAFLQKDYFAATEFFKKAIMINPQSDDAKYNLELALRKLTELKDKKNNNENKDKKNKDKKNEEKNKGKNKDRKDKGKTGEKGNKDSNDANDKKQNQKKQKAATSFDQKKANALLDNIKENREKFFRFQFRGKKKRSSNSRRNW